MANQDDKDISVRSMSGYMEALNRNGARSMVDERPYESLQETYKSGDRVRIITGPADVVGKTGYINKIHEGTYPGAPKTYVVEHADGTIELQNEQMCIAIKPIEQPTTNTPIVEAAPAVNPMPDYLSAITKDMNRMNGISEKKLTPAELKKREEIAKAMERETPGMDKSKKMAIATATAKRVAEQIEQLNEAGSKTCWPGYKKVGTQPGTGKNKGQLVNDCEKIEEDTNLSVAEGKEDKIAQLKKDHETAVHWSKNETSPQKREAARQKAEKIKRHLETQYKQGVAEGAGFDKLDKLTQKEDMHYCAKHIFSERFGEGLVIEGAHAEPDANGLIEWYDVDFGGTVRRVMTERVQVMHAEYHMNHKKKMKEEEDSDQASTTMKHVKNPTPGEKKAAKDIKPGIAGYRDRIAMLKSAEADGRLKEGKAHTIPKTDKEKSLAKLAPPHDKITHADVMVGRGVVKKEEVEQADEAASWNPIKHIPKDKQNDAIKTAAKDVKRGSYADRAALLKAGGVKKEEISTAQMGQQGKTTIKHIDKPGVELRMAAHDIKPGIAGYRDRIALLKAAQAQGKLKEEVEDLEELNQMTLSRYAGKARSDINTSLYSGDTSKANLDKIAKRAAGVKTANRKMASGEYSEEVEDLEELNKDTLTSYQDKADADITRKHRVLGPQIKAGDAKSANKTADTIQKRMAGVDRAVTRLNKEESDYSEMEESMISYGDFLDKMKMHRKAGNKIVDDKYDDKKASYTVIDQEGVGKKITHTDAGMKQQHLGSMKGDDAEADDNGKTAEKRSRGRPTGSKSGARR